MGAAFGGRPAVVRRLLRESDVIVLNLDKMGYASDLTSIEEELTTLGSDQADRHQLLKVDLADADAVYEAIQVADPDLVMHLAAESHVDRSIAGPGVFIESNVTGTYNLLQAVRDHHEGLSGDHRSPHRGTRLRPSSARWKKTTPTSRRRTRLR